MQTSLEQCPLCGSELSQTKFREIRAKQREQEDKKAAELVELRSELTKSLEQQFRAQLLQESRAMEKRLREEAQEQVKKAVAERELTTKKLKNAEMREAELRKQALLDVAKAEQAAEKKAKSEAAQELKKLTSERDLAAAKLKAAEAREAEIRRQAKEEADRSAQKELGEQRQVLEKDKNLALLTLQAQHNRDRESLQKKMKNLELQLEKKTANELGDGAEIIVFDALRDAFQGDKIRRIQKGENGADILHEVIYKGEVCGRIVVDSKNRKAWQNTFVSKLRQDKIEAKAEHAILATAVFPAGKKELCIESGVIVISPGRVVYITELIRQAMITMHIKGLSLTERSNKMGQLYNLITSERFSKKLAEADRLTQDILDLDVQEQKDHGIVWRKRGTLATRMKNVLQEVRMDIDAVVEGEGPEAKESGGLAVARAAS